MNDFSPPDPGQRRIFSVAELNRTARALLEGEFPSIWVEGEISNLARPASGHLYFSLKDSKAQVRCALFKNRALGLKTRPENGMQVLLRAGVSLYEGRGEFQLIVEYLEPAGAGALQRAFEELKRKLEAEGLFDPAHKQALPTFPKRIGVITSPSGAAIRDVLNVLKRRYPGVEVIIYPAPVQGTDAPAKLKRMLDVAIARNEVDVLLLTRGGGSLEDLWAFNDEPLARAIHACPLPIVSAVGHEIDFTIADFVADERAATPSAAAELLSPDQSQLLRQLARYESLLDRQMQQQLRNRKDRINSLQKRLPHPQRTLQQISQRLDDLTLRSQRAIKTDLNQRNSKLARLQALLSGQNPKRMLQQQRERAVRINTSLRRLIKLQLQRKTEKLQQLGHNLDTVSPLATLGRGYAIVQKDNGEIVRSTEQLVKDELLYGRFGTGNAKLKVSSIESDD